MSDWKKYDDDSFEDFSSAESSPADFPIYEGTYPSEIEPDEETETNTLFLRAIEKSTDSLKRKNALYRYAERLGNQGASVSDQHSQELLAFIDDLFENMDAEFGTMENAFTAVKNAFPCMNRLALQLFGPEKKYRPSFAETDLAKYVTDTIREGLYQHQYRDNWKDMSADILINGWRALLFFSQVWPQYHVRLVLLDMLEYMYTRPDIIEYCKKGKQQ